MNKYPWALVLGCVAVFGLSSRAEAADPMPRKDNPLSLYNAPALIFQPANEAAGTDDNGDAGANQYITLPPGPFSQPPGYATHSAMGHAVATQEDSGFFKYGWLAGPFLMVCGLASIRRKPTRGFFSS